MNNLNSILIEGNMVRDPLMRTITTGTAVCNFSIATNRYFRQGSGFERETGFFDIAAWGKLAEVCNERGRKGRGVRVVGRLKQERWDGSDGKKHSRITIVAEHIEYRSDVKKTGEPFSGNGDFENAPLSMIDNTLRSSESFDEQESEDLQEVAF